jgi:hypothetical protein
LWREAFFLRCLKISFSWKKSVTWNFLNACWGNSIKSILAFSFTLLKVLKKQEKCFSGKILIQDFSFPQNLLHSTIEPLPEYKTQSLKKSRFILSHYGVFKGFWDWLILVSTFYVAFVVPYNAAFVQTDRLTMAADVIVEALFIVGK